MKNKEYTLSEKLKEIAKLPTTNTINTLERKLLRIDIAQKMVNQGSYNKVDNSFTNEVKNNKRIDFVIGIPGSGKSSVLAKPLSEKHNALIIDSDFAKEMLPEYDNGLGATRVHLESKLIFNLALKTALENNMNIVIAIVGKTLDTIKGIYDEAEKYGYEQHLHLNEVPPNVAVQRTMERFKETGRYVEAEYIINEVGYKPTENYKILKDMAIYKSYEWYDNNVSFGEDPILIESIEPEKEGSFFIDSNNSKPEITNNINTKIGNKNMEKNYLFTPIGKIAFTKKEEDYYRNLSDIRLVKLYLQEREKNEFINPHTFEIMRKRNLIFRGDKMEDIEKRLVKMIIIKHKDILAGNELSEIKSIEDITRKLHYSYIKECENLYIKKLNEERIVRELEEIDEIGGKKHHIETTLVQLGYTQSDLARLKLDAYRDIQSNNNILKKGDYIKTGASDNTLVLKVKGEDAILFTGNQFIVAHGIQKDGDKVHWTWGDYYNELPNDVFDKDRVMEEPEYEDDWDLEL